MELTVNTPLFTKDGRRIGNAIIIGCNNDAFQIKTDYGNEMTLTEEEIKQEFYLPTQQELKLLLRRGVHKHSVLNNTDIALIFVISSLDEIDALNIKFAHPSKPNKWIRIEQDSATEFSVYGMVSGDSPTSVTTNGYYVKTWKNLENVKKALKRFADNGDWGMSHWKI